MKFWIIYITRGAPSEAQRICHYLCDEHAPTEGGTLTPEYEPSATVVSAKSRSVTEHEILNFGADECDACCGEVSIWGATPLQRKEPR